MIAVLSTIGLQMLGGVNISVLGIYPMLDFQLFTVQSIVALSRDLGHFLKRGNGKPAEPKWPTRVAEVVSCQSGARYRASRWSRHSPSRSWQILWHILIYLCKLTEICICMHMCVYTCIYSCIYPFLFFLALFFPFFFFYLPTCLPKQI